MNATRHRFWAVAALSLGPAVSNSFARFAYALILPAMQADLGWNYTEAGWLNTANALGYLAGALFTVRYVFAAGNHRLFAVGMFVTAAAIAASGLTGQFAPLLGLRFVSGAAGAMAFICGGVLASGAFPGRPKLASTAIAIYFAGGGVGILLSGAGIPWLLQAGGNRAWPAAWLALGGASFAFAGLSVAAARRIGEPSAGTARSRWAAAPFRCAFASYFLFGAGYIAYMTFVIAWMKDHGATAGDVTLTWSILGIATMLAPMTWRHALNRWRSGNMLAAPLAVVAVGAAIPLVNSTLPAMILSAALFGGAMFTVPTAVTALVKSGLPSAAWGSALAAFTVAFATGQSAGPVVTGWLADITGSLWAGLLGSAVTLLIAAAVAMRQREIQVAPPKAYRSGPQPFSETRSANNHRP